MSKLFSLFLLTLVTGLVNAFSYLVLGHVLVANMTGNVLFLALTLAGAPGFSISASLLALGSCILGSLLGGFLGSRLNRQQGRLLSLAATFQMLLLGVSVVWVMLAGDPLPEGDRSALIVVLSIAMGLQNAVARKLAVPDLTTTVLTLTIVGMGADSRLVGGNGSKVARRLLAVGAMFLGGFLGGRLIFQVSNSAPLMVALLLLALVAGTAQSAFVTPDLPLQIHDQVQVGKRQRRHRPKSGRPGSLNKQQRQRSGSKKSKRYQPHGRKRAAFVQTMC